MWVSNIDNDIFVGLTMQAQDPVKTPKEHPGTADNDIASKDHNTCIGWWYFIFLDLD